MQYEANYYYPFGMLQPGRSYVPANGYRYGFNGQATSTELNENLYNAKYWEYDSRIGKRWNRDPKPNYSLSPYAAFANNPILYDDVKGDTIRVTARIKNNPNFWGALTVLGKTTFRNVIKLYETSSSADIYINSSDRFEDWGSSVAKDNAIAVTDPWLKSSGEANKGGIRFDWSKLDDLPYLRDFDGHNILKSKGAEISLITLNERYLGQLDKYQLAFVLLHEINAHVLNKDPDADIQHDAFGGSSFNLSLSPLQRTEKGEIYWLYRPYSQAWSGLKQILKQKIDDKAATEQNTADYKAMSNYEYAHPQIKSNKKSNPARNR